MLTDIVKGFAKRFNVSSTADFAYRYLTRPYNKPEDRRRKGGKRRQDEFIPHHAFVDITDIDPKKVYDAGFKGIVLGFEQVLSYNDKYEIEPEFELTLKRFKKYFGSNMLICSDSIGTFGFLDEMHKVELNSGISVVTHLLKKPLCYENVLRTISQRVDDCINPDEILVIGSSCDRDIVMGNYMRAVTAKVEHDFDLEKVKRLAKENIFPPYNKRCLTNISKDSKEDAIKQAYSHNEW